MVRGGNGLDKPFMYLDFAGSEGCRHVGEIVRVVTVGWEGNWRHLYDG